MHPLNMSEMSPRLLPIAAEVMFPSQARLWLGTLFLGLRLADQIDWPWVWVLAPWWGFSLLSAIVYVNAFFVGIREYRKMEKAQHDAAVVSVHGPNWGN